MAFRTTDLDRIASSSPATRIAAITTGKGPTGATEDNRTERHRNLIRLLDQVRRALKLTDDAEKKKKLGQQHRRLQEAIRAEGGKPKRPLLPAVFMESAREMLPAGLFATILRDANNRYDKAIAAFESETPPLTSGVPKA